MTQPPQDRPDYPWGPTSDPAPAAPERAGVEQGGGQVHQQPPDELPTHGGQPSQQHGGEPHADQPPAAPGYAGQPPAGYAPGYAGQPPAGYAGGYAGGPPPAGPGGERPGVAPSTIVLLVLSGLALLVFVWFLVGAVYAAPLALAIVSMAKTSSDPRGARTFARAGWWTFAGVTAFGVLLAVVGAALFASLINSGGGSSDPFDASSTSLTGAALSVTASPASLVPPA